MTKMTNDDNRRNSASNSSDELLGVLGDAEIYFSDNSGWVHSHSLMAEGLKRRYVQISVGLAKIARAYKKSQCKESDQRLSIVVGSEKFQANLKETVDGLVAFRADLEKMDSERMPTSRLGEFCKNPLNLIDFTRLIPKPGKSKMTESLRLIIAEMVHDDQEESGEDITVDTTLLKLAEKGLASFIQVQRGKMIWAASPNLIKSINGRFVCSWPA